MWVESQCQWDCHQGSRSLAVVVVDFQVVSEGILGRGEAGISVIAALPFKKEQPLQ